ARRTLALRTRRKQSAQPRLRLTRRGILAAGTTRHGALGSLDRDEKLQRLTRQRLVPPGQRILAVPRTGNAGDRFAALVSDDRDAVIAFLPNNAAGAALGGDLHAGTVFKRGGGEKHCWSSQNE